MQSKFDLSINRVNNEKEICVEKLNAGSYLLHNLLFIISLFEKFLILKLFYFDRHCHLVSNMQKKNSHTLYIINCILWVYFVVASLFNF